MKMRIHHENGSAWTSVDDPNLSAAQLIEDLESMEFERFAVTLEAGQTLILGSEAIRRAAIEVWET